MLEVETLLKTTKSEALMFPVEPIRSGKEAAWCEGPTLLVIASAKECMFG